MNIYDEITIKYLENEYEVSRRIIEECNNKTSKYYNCNTCNSIRMIINNIYK